MIVVQSPKHLALVVVERELAYPKQVVEEDLMMPTLPKDWLLAVELVVNSLPKDSTFAVELVAGPLPKDSTLVEPVGPIHL